MIDWLEFSEMVSDVSLKHSPQIIELCNSLSFTPRLPAPDAQWLGRWVGPRTGLHCCGLAKNRDNFTAHQNIQSTVDLCESTKSFLGVSCQRWRQCAPPETSATSIGLRAITRQRILTRVAFVSEVNWKGKASDLTGQSHSATDNQLVLPPVLVSHPIY
jgi:hypothetical protein